MRLLRIVCCVLPCLIAVSCGSTETGVTPENTQATTETVTPSLQPTEAMPTEQPTPTGPLGSISGKIIPPNPDLNPLPASRVYAHEVTTGRVTLVELASGQVDYVVQGLPVGVYEIVGWFSPQGRAGAYTSRKINSAETSGDQLKCNTSLIRISLKEGRMDVEDVDINCWGGDFFYLITPLP